jgi:hypothetical protein
LLALNLRDIQVSDFVCAVGTEDVGGLEVTVKYPVFVEEMEALENLGCCPPDLGFLEIFGGVLLLLFY